MPELKFLYGYKPNFLDEHVPLPELNEHQKADVAPVDDADDGIAHYINYSLQLSKERGFPYFTATNIDGNAFKKAPRKDSWRIDKRISADHQWGPELYKAEKSDFDKGHMTKREDVQWGDSLAVAGKAADSTFFYSNSVPQHARLNQRIWRSLEDYILHTEAVNHDMKISVFTGPVLGKKDPWFVTKVKGRDVQIPYLFWKVVIFAKSDGALYRVGFLMSQYTLLFENGIVKEDVKEKAVPGEEEDQLFMEFQEADTYQVNVATIESLTGIKMPEANEPFKDDRKVQLVMEEIDVKESLKESANVYQQMGFFIQGLEL